MKYNDIESVNDLIKYLDDGNTLTMSQVSFVANKLNIESSRIETMINRRKEPEQVETNNELTGSEVVSIASLEQVTSFAMDGKTFSDYQIWALSKSLGVPEAEINNAIEQGYAEVPDMTGQANPLFKGGSPGPGLGGVGPLTDEDFDNIPVLPLNYQDTITYLIGIGVNVRFLGLDSPGYPLGYRARQAGGTQKDDKYGDYPVYLPDMADSIFGDLITSETEIISLQRKLVNAGYLTTTFDPGRFDSATEQAVETAMGVHNSDGRTPNVPEIAGALLDFYGVSADGTPVDPTVYGFTPERAREIKQFFMNELDVDIQNEDQRIRDDLVVEAPRIDEEQAAYTMLQVLQQQYGGLGIRYDNIKNASSLVNKLLKDVAVESKQKEKDSIAASKAAAEAALDKQQRIDLYRRSNPNLTDDELSALYPDVFAVETVDVVGEMGPFGTGAGDFRENLFANRLSRSMESLLKPELDLDEKRNALNDATANFYRAARGARNLVQGAPSINRGINT